MHDTKEMTSMHSFDLVSALQALPETDPIEVDGIQFGPTCTNGQGSGSGGCVALTVGVNLNVGGVLQTVVGGIGIGIGVLGTGAGAGC
jgi:hypothetical protein